MISGIGADVSWWTPEMIEPYSQNFKTIIFDNRGTGRTDKPDIPYSILMMANDTVGLMDALNIQKAHILGISMGGFIAQEIAITSPERVEKLVLCSTNCGGSKQILPSNEVIQKMTTPQDLRPEEWIDVMFSLGFTDDFRKNNPDFIKSYKQRVMEFFTPLDSLQRQTLANMGFSSGMRLKKISAPTLIMHGREDIIAPPENAEILAKRIPNAELVMLDKTGHFLVSAPEKVINILNDFLTGKIEIEAH
jgi:pimeloyl-ACP methyl ester carboxylesterase